MQNVRDKTPRSIVHFVAGGTLTVIIIGAASASDVIYETNDPFGSGVVTAYPINETQGIAARFTPELDVVLDNVTIWLMTPWDAGANTTITASLRTDGGESGASNPAGKTLETWEIAVDEGPASVFQANLTSVGSALSAGEHFWIALESETTVDNYAGWAIATPPSPGHISICCNSDGDWTNALAPSHMVSIIVTGTPTLFADFNGDGVVDILDLLTLLSDWGDCPVDAACHCDLNNDGVVDVFDLLLLLANWG